MLVIICGLDRSGKSTLAQTYVAKGFELIHQSAPPKGQTTDQFLEEQMQLITSAASKNIVLDRSYWGEYAVWPQVYGRESLLSEENLEVLRELETTVETERILMHDPNTEAHWKRCVDNNEPLTKSQFVKARSLYLAMAQKYGFQKKSLEHDYPHLLKAKGVEVVPVKLEISSMAKTNKISLSKEQIKLETANAINTVLSKRLVKPKGPIYDQIEVNLRTYLNGELAKIFGTKTDAPQSNIFSNEEVQLLKLFLERLKGKES